MDQQPTAFQEFLRRGWTGTRMENWITREFFSIIAEEYPDGGFPQ